MRNSGRDRTTAAPVQLEPDIQRLARLIYTHIERGKQLVAESGRFIIWEELVWLYQNLSAAQLASTKLNFDDHIPTHESIKICNGKSAPTIWAYALNSLLAPDTELPRLEVLRSAIADNFGEALTLCDDLADLRDDIAAGRWNMVTLTSALEYDTWPPKGKFNPLEYIKNLLDCHSIEHLAARMRSSFDACFEKLERVLEERCEPIRRQSRYLLSFPVYAALEMRKFD